MKNLIVPLVLGLAAWGGYRHFNAPESSEPASIAATAAPDPAAAGTAAAVPALHLRRPHPVSADAMAATDAMAAK